jgi:alanyl-tRNA synthetase
MSDEEIQKVENIVNDKIRENVPGIVKNNIPIEEAIKMGATALFGEKYGDKVRVITFDPEYSVELCGGTHAKATGQIGLFKIVSESGIAAGIRRIEAVTGKNAEEFVNEQINTLKQIKSQFKNASNIVQNVKTIIEENSKLHKELEKLMKEKSDNLSDELYNKAEKINDILLITEKTDLDVNSAKNLAHKLRTKNSNVFVILATENKNKVNLIIGLSDELVKRGFHAGTLIREIAKKIEGGGGGQPHLATAGGKNPEGIRSAFEAIRNILND